MHKTIGIIGGTGKMGQFFAKIFKRAGHTVLVSGKNTALKNTDIAQKCDAIIISVPIDATVSVIQEIGHLLLPHQCLTDFTSVKQQPLTAMMKYSSASVFGMHPMFAPTVSGSISGQNIIFCSGRGNEWEQFFKNIFEAEGASVEFLNATEHDEMMTIIQGLSHFLDITFANTLLEIHGNLEKIFKVSSPAYALKLTLMGRTLTQNAHLYGNIQISNPQNIKTLDTFLQVANRLKAIVEKKDMPAFENFFTSTAQYFGKFAEFSQQQSESVIEFLARKKKCTPSIKTHNHVPVLQNLETVGILGPENTFSHLAFEEFLHPMGKTPQFFTSLPLLFSALKKKEIPEALVPIENMLHGSIPESIDGITAGETPISALFEMKISPSLFTNKNTKKEDIHTIFSHSQPLAQCSQFLEKEFPNVHIMAVNSTAEAMDRMMQESNTGAISAPQMVDIFNVQEIAKNIANTSKNATRFAFLSQTAKIKGQKYEGVIVFSFAKDAPGSLENVLHDFSALSLNLTKIESRPLGTAFGDYLFFVQFEGKIDEHTQKILMENITAKTTFCNFLGNFPVLKAQK